MFWIKSSSFDLRAKDSGGQGVALPSQPPNGFLPSEPGDASSPRWLADTPQLQTTRQKIRLLAQRLTQLKHTSRQKALACYSFVRDLPFVCLANSNVLTATEVLQRGAGDCHSKGTLMVSLLRASGVPSRLRLVTLKADFMLGLIDMKGLPVEHVMTEVWVEGRWAPVDSYVMDPKLALAARMRLTRERISLGYGMHVRGSTTWDGQGPAFAQFSLSDQASLPLKDWGAFDDPQQFYSTVPQMRGHRQWAQRARWAVGVALVNRRVLALRHSLDKAP